MTAPDIGLRAPEAIQLARRSTVSRPEGEIPAEYERKPGNPCAATPESIYSTSPGRSGPHTCGSPLRGRHTIQV